MNNIILIIFNNYYIYLCKKWRILILCKMNNIILIAASRRICPKGLLFLIVVIFISVKNGVF